MINELELAELLAAKFCHDMAGPIGAVNNGIEFLSEEEFEMKDQAISLVETSAREASTRLLFYRQAYGKINVPGEANLGALKTLVSNFLGNGKVTLDWPDQHTDASSLSVSQRMGKFLLNLIVVMTGTLIQGGNLSIRLQKLENADAQILLQGTGKTIKVDEETEKLLLGKGEGIPITARNVQIYLTHLLATELGVKLSLLHDARICEMSAVYKRQRQMA